MKIFVLEYATAYGIKKFTEEGVLMKKLMIEGLTKAGIDAVEIENSDEKTGRTKYLEKNNTAKTINKTTNKITDAIIKKYREADKVILIAPEKKMLELSEIIPENKLLASNHHALEVSCNKFKTYCALKDKVKMPETEIYREIYSGSDAGKSNGNIKPDGNIKYPFVLKPIYGSGCENLHFVRDKGEFDKIKKKPDENYLIQKYVKGVHASVSLFCGEEPFPVSLNLQFINLKLKSEYLGCLVPYEHKLKEKVFNSAKKAAELLKLRGYVGMDFVLGDDAYLIEINPRITTSAAAINLSSRANIAVLHLNCFEKEKNIREDVKKIKFSDTVLLSKKQIHQTPK